MDNKLTKKRHYIYRIEIDINIDEDGRGTISKCTGKQSATNQFHTTPIFGPRLIIPGSLIIDATTFAFIPEPSYAS